MRTFKAFDAGHILAKALGRRPVEQKLRESEEQFRSLADIAPVLIWQSGPDKLCTYFNKPWLDFTGRSIESELGNGWAEGVHADDLQRCLETYTQAFDRREKFEMQYQLRRNDGEYRWLLDVGVPRYDEGGLFAGYVGICVDFTDRKRTEEALQRREMELVESQRVAGVGSWQWDPSTDKVTWSKELYRLFGLDARLPAPSFNEHVSLFEAESWERLQGVVKEALQAGAPYELDLEILSPELTITWTTARGEPVHDERGQIMGLRGTVQNITERKLTERAITDLSLKRIEAQEQERSRIGRELHDDIGQRLAMLAIELQGLQDNSLILPEVRSRIGELQNQAVEISASVQSLSHELHSAKLQYLGLARAMRNFCQEFGEQQGLEIDFPAPALASPVSPDVALCLFRILQEALHNAAKHSGVRLFEVRLWETSEEIHMTVRDSGSGFVSESAKESRGLGLISMEERLKLVKGKLSIESQPRLGTTIHARVPVSSSTDFLRAAG